MRVPPLITLLTDFGTQDTYAGQMRGVIATIAPAAVVIDLTHQIDPQNLLQGACVWADAVAAFPPDTIHIGVVDPGVGSTRRAVAVEIGPWRFVAPDNGLLTAVRQTWPTQAAVELNRPQWHRSSVASTFHGRDLFAPAAAHWACGVALGDLGTPLTGPLIELPLPPVLKRAGGVCGEVLWCDRFGNLLTNIRRCDVPAECSLEDIAVQIAGATIRGIARCYAQAAPQQLLALWSSSDRLEIAVNGGSAAAVLGAGRGEPLLAEWDGSAV